MYKVIESRAWRNNQGHTVSIYGALPYSTEAQKIAEGWEIVVRGWTVRNPFTNEIGVGRVPWKTREEAQAFADTHTPSRHSMYD